MSRYYYISCRRPTRPVITPAKGMRDRITCNQAHLKTKPFATVISVSEFDILIPNKVSLIPATTSEVNDTIRTVHVAARHKGAHCCWLLRYYSIMWLVSLAPLGVDYHRHIMQGRDNYTPFQFIQKKHHLTEGGNEVPIIEQ